MSDKECVDPELVQSLTDEIVGSGLSPVIIDGVGFFMKKVNGKPGKIIIFGIAMFRYTKEGKNSYLETKEGKCVLIDVYQMSAKDREPGVTFSIKKENLVTRECMHYRNKSELGNGINAARDRLTQILKELRD